MAEATKGTTNPTLSTPWPSAESLITGLYAGEDLGFADVVYLKQSDNKVWKATGAAANAAARAIGFTTNRCKAGDPITLIRKGSGVMIGYQPIISAAAAPAAARLYLSGTVPGGLADAASTGGTEILAWVVGDGRICVDSA